LRITSKVTLFFFLLVSLAGGVLVFLSHVSFERELEAETRDRFEDLAFHSMDKIDRILFERLSDLNVMERDNLLASPAAPPAEITARLIRYRIEEELLCELAGDLAFGIRSLRTEAEVKVTAQALKESEERFKSIFESALDGIIVADAATRKFLMANKAMCDMLGYDKDEIGNLGVGDIHPEEELPRIAEVFEKQSKSEVRISIDLPVKRKDGTVYYAGIRSAPLTIRNHRYLLGVFRDMTERRRMEDELKEPLASLERRVAERTKELSESNKELESFAHVVSHDLKAPLRGIASLAGWFVGDYADKVDDEGRDTLNLLIRRVRRMNNLIDGILQYSRVGRKREEMTRAALKPMLENMIDLLAAPKGVEIRIETKMPVVTCEKTRIFQVFENLVGNAVKHMDKPEGVVRIGCDDPSPEPPVHTFYVSDNGPGIEERHFERIFQMFQTLDAREDAESTGVGLAIVKRIVELHGGRIWVESKVGEGTTFRFTLPAGPAEAAASFEREEPAEPIV